MWLQEVVVYLFRSLYVSKPVAGGNPFTVDEMEFIFGHLHISLFIGDHNSH